MALQHALQHLGKDAHACLVSPKAAPLKIAVAAYLKQVKGF
jgi:hypothetical protein